LQVRGFGNQQHGDREAFERGNHFALAARKGGIERPARAAMVHGAKRFQLVRRPGRQERVDVPGFGGVEQLPEEGRRDVRHIASHYQVPVRAGVLQSGEDTAQRPFAGVFIGDHSETAGNPSRGTSDEGRMARGRLHFLRNRLSQDPAAKGKQRLVSTHPGTTPPHEHVPRPAHTKMIPSRVHWPSGRTQGWTAPALEAKFGLRPRAADTMRECNILPRFCFRLGWSMGLGTMVLCAGGLPDSSQGRLTSVVRADRRTGKLVRVVRTPPGSAQSPSALFSTTVERIAAEQALPPELIHSVIQAESNYNPFAVSPKGALGIMQLVPETARRFGVANAFDVVDNMRGGARYLKYLLDLYHGDYPLALAAYNAGEAAVARHGGVPPYPETRNYVRAVRKELEKAAVSSMEPKPQEGGEGMGEARPNAVNPIRQIVEPDGTVRYVSR
jgi:hypothetical protein